MTQRRSRILLVMEQCNPAWPSVPLVAYKLFDAVSALADVTLVTHERNRAEMEPVRNGRTVHYIAESRLLAAYYRCVAKCTGGGGVCLQQLLVLCRGLRLVLCCG